MKWEVFASIPASLQNNVNQVILFVMVTFRVSTSIVLLIKSGSAHSD